MVNVREKIKERIKERRVQLGLTQKQLGEKTGLTYQTILNLEKGKACTLQSLIKVCEALEIDLDLD